MEAPETPVLRDLHGMNSVGHFTGSLLYSTINLVVRQVMLMSSLYKIKIIATRTRPTFRKDKALENGTDSAGTAYLTCWWAIAESNKLYTWLGPGWTTIEYLWPVHWVSGAGTWGVHTWWSSLNHSHNTIHYAETPRRQLCCGFYCCNQRRLHKTQGITRFTSRSFGAGLG